MIEKAVDAKITASSDSSKVRIGLIAISRRNKVAISRVSE